MYIGAPGGLAPLKVGLGYGFMERSSQVPGLPGAGVLRA